MKPPCGGKRRRLCCPQALSSRKLQRDTRFHYLYGYTLGELGKIVLINIREGKMLLQAEIYKGPDDMPAPLVQQKQHVFEYIVTTVNNRFDENFPD